MQLFFSKNIIYFLTEKKSSNFVYRKMDFRVDCWLFESKEWILIFSLKIDFWSLDFVESESELLVGFNAEYPTVLFFMADGKSIRKVFTVIIYLYSLLCSYMIKLDQDLFFIEDILSIFVFLRSLNTFYEDWQRIGFSRTLDWYHVSQLKMTSPDYRGLSVRIVHNIWEPLFSFWEGRLMKCDIAKYYLISNLLL